MYMLGMVWLFIGLSGLAGAWWCWKWGYIQQEHRDLIVGCIWTTLGAVILYFFFTSTNPHKWGVPGCTAYEREMGLCGGPPMRTPPHHAAGAGGTSSPISRP